MENPQSTDEIIADLVRAKQARDENTAKLKAEEEARRSDERLARQRAEIEWENADEGIRAEVERRSAALNAAAIELKYEQTDKQVDDALGEYMIYFDVSSEGINIAVQALLYPRFGGITDAVVVARGETLDRFSFTTKEIDPAVEVENLLNSLLRHARAG